VRSVVKTLFIAVGILSVALGVLGMFLPILPTTPFLLLAAYCFSKSSERLHRQLMENRWFGRYLRDYRDGKGVPLRAKVIAISTIWLSIGYLVFIRLHFIGAKVLLLCIAVAVTVHLVRLKTAAPRGHDGATSKAQPVGSNMREG
jgi:uncharacterized membrane protein YbaN (DUF454 family)